MIVEERLTTYIDSLNWQIPACLKEVEKEALADGVPIIAWLFASDKETGCCT